MLCPAAATTNASMGGRKDGQERARCVCERGLLCHHDMILKGSCDGRQGGEQQDELAGSCALV